MSINFVLCHWDGKVEEESYDESAAFTVFLMDLLYDPKARHSTEFILLKYVDEYELVRFNARQMPDLIADLERLKSLVPSGRRHDEMVLTIDRFIRLAERCQSDRGLFLDFIGD